MTDFTEVRAVSFDFFNTLVHHRSGRGRGTMLMEYFEEQRLASDPWEHEVLYDVFEPHGIEYAPDQPLEERKRYHRRLSRRVFQRLRVRAPAGVAAEHADSVWRLLGPDSLAVYPEVADLLVRLREEGYPLAVVSNWQCGLAHFCTELGLGDYFDHVLASAEVGSQKPDPGIFAEACRRLGVPEGRVLHVGDDAIDDLEGATGAGLRAVLVRREPEPGPRTASEEAHRPRERRSNAARADAPIIPSLDGLRQLLGLGVEEADGPPGCSPNGPTQGAGTLDR